MTPKTCDASCEVTPAKGGQKFVLAVLGLFLVAVFATSFLTRMDNAPLVRRTEVPPDMMQSQGNEEMNRVRELMRQLGENPGDPELNLALGEEFLRIGNIENAQHFLFDALVAEPGNGKVLYLLGLSEFELEAYGEAAGYFEQLLEVGMDFPDAPTEVDVRNILGVTYFRLDRMPDAGPQFEKILEMEPDNALAMLNLGIVYNYSDRREEAVALLEQVLASDAAEEIKTMARSELEAGAPDTQTQDMEETPDQESGDDSASPRHDPEAEAP